MGSPLRVPQVRRGRQALLAHKARKGRLALPGHKVHKGRLVLPDLPARKEIRAQHRLCELLLAQARFNAAAMKLWFLCFARAARPMATNAPPQTLQPPACAYESECRTECPLLVKRTWRRRILMPATPESGYRALHTYFNGTIAVTSISIIMPGHASWLMVSSV